MRQIFVLVLCLLLVGCGHSVKVLSEANQAHAQLLKLIVVGDSLDEAETKIKDAGFRFVYPKAIDPTGRGECLNQLVCVHPIYAQPTALDSFRYTVGLSGPKSATPPYVVVEADMTGKITRVQ
jgi:hypothetical protein